MPRPVVKILRVKAGIPERVSVEAELGIEGSHEKSRGLMVVSLYTVEGPIPGFRYREMIDSLSRFAKDNHCRIEKGIPQTWIMCDSALITVDTRTVAEEFGLSIALLASNDNDQDTDIIVEEIEDIARELGFDPEDIMDKYISVELAIYLSLEKLGWLEDNIGFLLLSMDLLETRYMAKIIVYDKPRKMDPIRELEDNYNIRPLILSGATSIYIRGVHALRDPKFYSILRKAFSKGLIDLFSIRR